MIALIPALLLAAAFGGSTFAQTLDEHSFGFKFAGSVRHRFTAPWRRLLTRITQTAIDIVQCNTISLATIPVNSTVAYYGVPPYTVLSFEAGGVSDRQEAGNNASNIPWIVRHGPGAYTGVRCSGSAGLITLLVTLKWALRRRTRLAHHHRQQR
jgi:hypothetical protein